MFDPESHHHATGFAFRLPSVRVEAADRVRDRAAADWGGRVVYGITSQPVASELASTPAAATTGSARPPEVREQVSAADASDIGPWVLEGCEGPTGVADPGSFATAKLRDQGLALRARGIARPDPPSQQTENQSLRSVELKLLSA